MSLEQRENSSRSFSKGDLSPTIHLVTEEKFLVLLEVGPPHRTWHVGVLLDVLARGEHGPQLAEERAVVAVVELAELRPDGLGGLLSLVEGNATVVSLLVEKFIGRSGGRDNSREKVVYNVVRDDVVEQVAANPAEVAVDGGKGALDVGP